MTSIITARERFNRILYFFPFQLLLLHIKKNHLLLVFWLLIFGFITQNIGNKYGIPILFLYPEYLEENNFWSFAIMGFSAGGFIVAFHLYSYIMHGFRFPFIASLNKPFLKFSINNFIVPSLFLITYAGFSLHYQISTELVPVSTAIFNVFGFVAGVFLFIILSFAYFFKTNKDVTWHIGKWQQKKKVDVTGTAVTSDVRRWRNIGKINRTWRVETYLFSPLKVHLARDSKHYNDDVLAEVLEQNHINASIFEIIIIISFLLIGSLRGIDFLMIPAGASVFLLFTMFLMVISAFFSWFKGWAMTILAIVIFLVNILSAKNQLLFAETNAFGLKYDVERVDYKEYLKTGLPTVSEIDSSKENAVEMLEKWKVTVQKEFKIRKPKIIILNSSGGGLRSSLWTYLCLAYLDSVTDGSLYKHTKLITGSSGGMIGQAVFREQKIADYNNTPFLSTSECFNAISKDLLNPVTMSLVTYDMFIRYQTITDGDEVYTKDRGYSFEKQLNTNTEGVFADKRLSAYSQLEKEAIIPQTIFSPVIINDGRKLLISSTSVPYLSVSDHKIGEENLLSEHIDFHHIFKENTPDNLKLTTAIRMSATFPYILPAVNLPTTPTIDVMDAGLRDNYGMTIGLAYINTFKEWIAENTSGVVVVQFRDMPKHSQFNTKVSDSFLKSLISPIGNVYDNLFNTHDYIQNEQVLQLKENIGFPLDVISFELPAEEDKKVSLSWHLSTLETELIRRGIYTEHNSESIEKVRMILP
jgi:hypothetical protein